MHNSTMLLRFQTFPLLYASRESYTEASTTTVLIQCQVVNITTAVMVDNLVEKVDECPLNQDC